MADNTFHYKFLLLSCAPKSGQKMLILRYIHNQYLPKYEPTIDDVYKKQLAIGNKNYSIEMLLGSQHPQLQATRELHIRHVEGIMIVYSVTSEEGLAGIPLVFEEIYGHRSDKVPIILVGTKCDLDEKRVVSKEQGEELARRLNVQHVEVSAKNNINVAECFMTLLQEVEGWATAQNKAAKKKERCIIC